MTTAIIGEAGSGKTTIFKALSKTYDVSIEADAEIIKIYKDRKTIDFFLKEEKLSRAVVDYDIIRSLLITILVNNEDVKIKLENFLYETFFLPIIADCISKNKSLLVDGIVPRLTKNFEQVIIVSTSNKVRRENLLKRGVSAKRIEEIFELQKNFLKDYLTE